jgi:hypothetical protein
MKDESEKQRVGETGIRRTKRSRKNISPFPRFADSPIRSLVFPLGSRTWLLAVQFLTVVGKHDRNGHLENPAQSHC